MKFIFNVSDGIEPFRIIQSIFRLTYFEATFLFCLATFLLNSLATLNFAKFLYPSNLLNSFLSDGNLSLNSLNDGILLAPKIF